MFDWILKRGREIKQLPELKDVNRKRQQKLHKALKEEVYIPKSLYQKEFITKSLYQKFYIKFCIKKFILKFIKIY